MFAVRSVDRVGKGIRTAPRDALISESVPEGKAGRAFGLHRSVDQAGAILGPLITFALFSFVGFAGVFYLSLTPGAVAVIILVFLVREKFVPSGFTRSIAGNIRRVLAEKRFVALGNNGRVQHRRIQLIVCAGKSFRPRGSRQHGSFDLCRDKRGPCPDRVPCRDTG
ncbi:MAG TPA: MFS transporter, partial [Nitrososphaera sp.]|nr:MFS transporter [Nitrososphaera sp.]